MSEFIKPFEFTTVPSILVEWEGARRLGEILAGRFTERQVLIVTDGGLVKAGLLEPVEQSLRSHGFEVTVFDRVVADPPEALVLESAQLARDHQINLVVGLGGGSSLDVAKLTAILANSSQELSGLYGIDNVRGQRLPLVQIPTTAGTGSEVTNISILTTGETTKMGVVSRQLYCDFVLLDAQLTVGLPATHTAATGIDAMVHAIEAYTSQHKKNPLSDALAREALRLISGQLVIVCRNGSDRKAREAVLLGATLAGQAFSNSPVAAVHALAYPLGGHYHIPHGLSNALMLGAVLRYNARQAAPLYAELADVLNVAAGGDVNARCDAFIEEMIRIMDESGAPRRLRDVGVKEDTLPLLASDAMKQTRLLINNPVEVTEADALDLYRQAF